jgi:hypothetical protein
MNRIGLLALVALPFSPLAYSQRASAHVSQPAPTAQVIILGNSVVPLEQGWKFQPGDSPWVNGAPLWAQPDYDDSHWAPMNLAPKAGTVDLQFGTSGYVPGWTAQGYPNLSGYAWYRLRLRVVNPGRPLWLKMPINYDDVYQLYANGRYVGQYGNFSPGHVTEYYTEPVSFALPKPGVDETIVLALRFYMSTATALFNPDAGGMHGPPALGLASTVGLMHASERDVLLRVYFSTLLMAFIELLTAPLALWAWLCNRRSRVWLWLFLAIAWELFIHVQTPLAALTTVLTVRENMWLSVPVLPLFAIFWWHWFGLEEKRWIPRAAWLLAAAATLASFLAFSPYLGFSFVPRPALSWCNDLAIWSNAGISLLEIVILVEGFRRDRLEALLPAVPILLGLFNAFGNYLLVAFHIPNEFFPFGLGIQVGHVVDFLTITIIVGLALRRFMKTQVRESLIRQAVNRDLEQAQQLQQRVLVPETVTSPAFAVESAYHPAQTVGGDFFQTLTRPDDTLLVVVGDVSGKGVSASMLVAVLVGAIRCQAESSLNPQAMLAMLNRRMIGRSGGHFATCLAAEIAPDGAMRLANAGHLPPYLNGKEIKLEGSLPLGFAEDADYPLQTMNLQPGDRLTFITDGVVEAKNRAKELFGFERTRAISGEQAAFIAQQAQAFGQQDDITVVRVAFAAA